MSANISTADRVTKAHDVLRDTIHAVNVEAFQRTAILSAAESFAKECVRAELASLIAELDCGRQVDA